jgi:hypothetical protein
VTGSPLHIAMLGAAVMACVVVALHFLRYWRLAADRFFVFFALAFVSFACGFAIRAITSEHDYVVYLPRLIGFLVILIAIFDKNRRSK